MGYALIGFAAVAWILLYEPDWIMNHWSHWMRVW